jgi:hypothetical protein
MISINALSLIAYFTYNYIDIIIFALRSTSWSYIIFCMVGRVMTDPSLGLLTPYEMVLAPARRLQPPPRPSTLPSYHARSKWHPHCPICYRPLLVFSPPEPLYTQSSSMPPLPPLIDPNPNSTPGSAATTPINPPPLAARPTPSLYDHLSLPLPSPLQRLSPTNPRGEGIA